MSVQGDMAEVINKMQVIQRSLKFEERENSDNKKLALRKIDDLSATNEHLSKQLDESQRECSRLKLQTKRLTHLFLAEIHDPQNIASNKGVTAKVTSSGPWIVHLPSLDPNITIEMIEETFASHGAIGVAHFGGKKKNGFFTTTKREAKILLRKRWFTMVLPDKKLHFQVIKSHQ